MRNMFEYLFRNVKLRKGGCDMISVEAFKGKSVTDQSVEIVERKGVGHSVGRETMEDIHGKNHCRRLLGKGE